MSKVEFKNGKWTFIRETGNMESISGESQICMGCKGQSTRQLAEAISEKTKVGKHASRLKPPVLNNKSFKPPGTECKIRGNNGCSPDICKWMKYYNDFKGEFKTEIINTITMKTHSTIKKLVLTLLLALVLTTISRAQVGTLTNTGNMSVCLNSTESFGVMPIAGSTYTWSIIPGTGGAGTINNGAAPNNLITVNWTATGTCTLQVTETNSSNCSAVINSIVITVNPLPIVSNSTASVCSGSSTGVTLATTSDNSLTVSKWDITASVGAGLTGSATTGNGLTSATAIQSDTYANVTSASANVVYTVTPYTGNCAGSSYTVTVTVTPEPVVAAAATTVCSGSVSGITLATTSTNSLTVNKWDITATTGAGLTGTATTGTGLTSASAILNDTFVNVTGSPINVVYTVTPYAGSCAGDSYTITLTVSPAPVVSASTTAVCSGSITGVTLVTASNNGLTVDKWNISAVVGAGLTGPATTGSGLTSSTAIQSDTFVNTTSAPVTVVYTVTPYSGTCVGASYTITVTVNPLPAASPIYHN